MANESSKHVLEHVLGALDEITIIFPAYMLYHGTVLNSA